LVQLHSQDGAAIGDFLAAAVVTEEFMLVCDLYDQAMRLRSLNIAAAALAA